MTETSEGYFVSKERWEAVEALVRAARDAEREIGGCTCSEAWTSRGLTDNINCRYHAVGDVEVEHLRAALVPFETVAKEG
jgi:hypothetical protein